MPVDTPGSFTQGNVLPPYEANFQVEGDINSMDPAAKLKGFEGNAASSGKNLLPYYVTPPRHTGPTEAERKIEELTRQLEEEMEKQEEEGEYFGKLQY